MAASEHEEQTAQELLRKTETYVVAVLINVFLRGASLGSFSENIVFVVTQRIEAEWCCVRFPSSGFYIVRQSVDMAHYWGSNVAPRIARIRMVFPVFDILVIQPSTTPVGIVPRNAHIS